jgi:hypothetical protein
MAQFDDLTPCTYLPVPSESLVSVGWLSKGHEFPRGEVSATFFETLKSLCREPWQPVVAAGGHQCELCQFEGPRFYSNVFVPYEGSIYVAPVAITHYIAAHWYRPPDVFVQAVLECPPMNSMAYKKAILTNGGRTLVKATAG